jgi:hypothetical protein
MWGKFLKDEGITKIGALPRQKLKGILFSKVISSSKALHNTKNGPNFLYVKQTR